MTDTATTASQNPHRFRDKYPWLGTEPLPVDRFTDPAYFEREREMIFKKVWWAVGRVEELPDPGCYKVRTLHFLKTSILVTRGRDGKVRAFYNICPHRGNTVVSEVPGTHDFTGKVRGHALSCRFHGWVFNTVGDNLFIPRKEGFHDTCRQEELGLIPIACDVWEGFIFVNVDPKPQWTLAEYLGSYGRHMAGYDYARATQRMRFYTYLKCNWKVALYAFAEGYHVLTVHAGSLPCDWCDVSDITFRGSHHTSAVHFRNDTFSLGAVQAMSYGRVASSIIDTSRKRSMLPSHMNPRQEPFYAFELAPMFPSFVLHPSEGFYFTHQFWPVSVNECLWEGTYYLVPPETNSARWAMEYSRALQRNAWLEDTETMEHTQRALESGMLKRMHLCDDEIMVRHLHHVIDSWVDGKPVMEDRA